MKLQLPEAVKEACAILAADKRQAYAVGGGIRDLVLGVTPQDWDLATDASPSAAAAIFDRAGFRVVPTGVKYGTITVYVRDLPLEVTTFRVEGRYHDRRRPSSVRFVHSIEQDLARRDFTVNAIAYDPLREVLSDPFAGLDDLLRMRIRSVGDPDARIAEDALRIMRAIRLASDYGFCIEERTWHAIVRSAELIRGISRERVRDELNRILMSANFVDGMQNLLEAGLLFLIIPELCEGWLLSQFHPFHQHTVLDHTLEALRYTPSSLEVRLAILLHDVGKPRSFSRGADGRGHFYGHELLGSEMAEQILQTMHYSSRIIKKVTFLIREHMLNLYMGPAAMRRLIARIGREAVPDLISVAQADFMAHSTQLLVRLADSWESFRSRLSFVLSEDTAFHLHDLAINGTDLLQELGCRPGPLVGRILKALWGEVLNEPLKNKRSYLLKRAREIAAELSRA